MKLKEHLQKFLMFSRTKEDLVDQDVRQICGWNTWEEEASTHGYEFATALRTKYRQGQSCSAYKLLALIFEHKPGGWMYQEHALYNMGREKSFDLDVATELDPSLSFPYKYSALAVVEEKQIKAGILVLDKIIGIKISPDCLELRTWLFIALQDYDNVMRDIRALLTLEPI